MSKPKILLFSGSIRSGSVNHRLAMSIAKSLTAKDVEANVLDLSNFDMPIYHDDIEHHGLPQAIYDFAAQVNAHDGIVITSPEYNASVSPLLKNALDWLSRVKEIDGHAVEPIKRKPVAIAACSPGANGGIRGLSHLRDILVNLGALILTEQLAVGNAMAAFDEDLNLTNERSNLICDDMCDAIIHYSKYKRT